LLLSDIQINITPHSLQQRQREFYPTRLWVGEKIPRRRRSEGSVLRVKRLKAFAKVLLAFLQRQRRRSFFTPVSTVSFRGKKCSKVSVKKFLGN
jgi:hypothetical protein